MLMKRVLTGLVLLSLVVSGVLFLPTYLISIIVALLCLMAGWEMLSMSFAPKSSAVILLFLSTLTYFIKNNMFAFGLFMDLIISWWLLCVLLIVIFPKSLPIFNKKIYQPFIALVIFSPLWIFVPDLHAESKNGPIVLLLIILVVSSADIGAYFFGRFLGKHKFVPKVSPGKTWVGVLGGYISAYLLIGGVKAANLIRVDDKILILVAVIVTFAIIGDLVQSMCKRAHNVKDSGNILPGHGGIFDRLDSLFAALPVAVIFSGYLGVKL